MSKQDFLYAVRASYLYACGDVAEGLILSIIEDGAGEDEWIPFSSYTLAKRPGLSSLGSSTIRRKLASMQDKGILLSKPHIGAVGHARLFSINRRRLNELIAQTQNPSAD